MLLKFISVSALYGSTLAFSSEWTLWKRLHQKSYSNKAEDSQRFKTFLDNKKFIMEHNARFDAGLETHYLGLTKMADLTAEEFEALYLNAPGPDPVLKTQFQCPEQFDDTTTEIPANFDWRFADQNDLNLVAVTAVKDQGSCGSCWTFGAAATMEGSMCIQGSYDCSSWSGLSEQNMVDCASYNSTFLGSYNDNGCSGGEQSNAIRWAWLAGGISSEETYPYVSGTTGSKQTCMQPEISATVTDSVCGTTSYNGADSPLLARAVMAKGPVTIGIDAGGLAFSLYSGGVYSSTSCSGRRINHAVTTVGFGVDTTSEMPYWTIKNSWGTGWGLDGYILVERGVDMCGVERDTQYALMSAEVPQ